MISQKLKEMIVGSFMTLIVSGVLAMVTLLWNINNTQVVIVETIKNDRDRGNEKDKIQDKSISLNSDKIDLHDKEIVNIKIELRTNKAMQAKKEREMYPYAPKRIDNGQ